MERTKIQITDTYRCFLRILTGTAHAHTVRVKDLLFHLYHLYVYGWGWVEDVSQNIHAYRVRAVRIISFYFILHPPPPFYFTVGKAPPQYRDDLVISTKKMNSLRTVPSEFFVQNVM